MATPEAFSIDLGYPIDYDQAQAIQDAQASVADTLDSQGYTSIEVTSATLTSFTVTIVGTYLPPGTRTPSPFMSGTGFDWGADQVASVQAAKDRFSTILTQMGFRKVTFTSGEVTQYTVSVSGTAVAPGDV